MFWLVYPTAIGDVIRRHLKDYQLEGETLVTHAILTQAHATVTPEAAVFVRGRHLAHHGRIDDQHVALGQSARGDAT
jgi:hypothetical protein